MTDYSLPRKVPYWRERNFWCKSCGATVYCRMDDPPQKCRYCSHDQFRRQSAVDWWFISITHGDGICIALEAIYYAFIYQITPAMILGAIFAINLAMMLLRFHNVISYEFWTTSMFVMHGEFLLYMIWQWMLE